MTLGSRLRAWRDRAGLSQTQAAERLACTQAAYSAWEANKSVPTLESSGRIAKLLRVSLATLVRETSAERRRRAA